VRLFRHLAWRALAAFLGSLSAVVALFLVVDFAENAAVFKGEGWVWAALELYANRSAVVVYQTAPAAMLLAAAVTASGLRKTREYTALRALGLGPWRVAAPVAVVAALVGAGLAVFDDTIASGAIARADEIMATRFNRRSGALQQWNEQKHWFRSRDGQRIYHLRGGREGSFERVTVLDIAPGFRLGRRIDAVRMAPGETDGEWVLEGVEERTFDPEGRMSLTAFPRRVYRFEEGRDAFALLPGRPSQMRRVTLLQQIRLRRALGLPANDFELEWHNKLAYPLAGLAAGLVALALALRPDRKGHLTASLIEAVGVSLAFWITQGVAWSFGLAGRFPPMLAAWLPDALFLGAGVWALRRRV
jgi:lipopolysaccharide export system permease protein